jgi:hypothetical protein
LAAKQRYNKTSVLGGITLQLFIYLSAVILVFLSLVHFYWVFGGKWGIRAALPEKIGGGAVLTPRLIETLIVAIGLMSLGVILLVQNNLISILSPNSFTKWTCILFTFIFILRSIGDFKYLGLFKKIRNSTFAKNDTRIYTPLCLYLGFIFMISWI